MEFFRLLWLNIKVSVWNAVEFCKVVRRYYGNKKFRQVDCALIREYLFINPYRISKRYLIEQGAQDIYTYGETPLTTMEIIAKECGISAKDVVYELGCGRGRTCFWLHDFIGCKTVGIEIIQFFVEKAIRVINRYQVEEVEFRQEDMLETDLSDATVVYLYGTCYDDAFIHALIKKFSRLPKGSRVLTVSYSLEEFGAKEFVLERMFTVSFTWGEANVYLQRRL